MSSATLSRTVHPRVSNSGSRLRVSWWRELALLAALYGVYMLARALVGVQPDAALDRGQWLLDLEAASWLDVERPLNTALHAVPLLAVLADYIYASLHYVLTPIVLVWLAVRHRAGYRQGRNALLVATALGLGRVLAAPDRSPAAAGGRRLPRHDGGLQRVGLVGRGRKCTARLGGTEQPVRRAAVAARGLGAVGGAAGACQHDPSRPAPLGLDLSGPDHCGRDGHGQPLPARRRRGRGRGPGRARRHAAARVRQAHRPRGSRCTRSLCRRRRASPHRPRSGYVPPASRRPR